MKKFLPALFAFLLAVLSCNFPTGPRPALTPDIPLAVSSPTSPSIDVPTVAAPTAPLSGKIVFTCQVFKIQASNQICIIHADGSGFRRLTTDDARQHYYPSLAPDGRSVVYAAFVEANRYDIYEMRLDDGNVITLVEDVGVANAPELSPDGQRVVFMRWGPDAVYAIWMVDRNAENLHQVFGPPDGSGWDPTWSPDGGQILFASDMDGSIQLYVINIDGTNLRKVTSMAGLRGRSDWSPDGQWIVTYAGEPWKRELYLMRAEGSNLRQVGPPGGNSQGPSFSPDGQWLAFTSYFDHYRDDNGCEIYIMRLDGSDLRRLTDNDYCDYQPRWGP